MRGKEASGGSRERDGVMENEGNCLVYMYRLDSDPSVGTLSCTNFNEEVVMHLSEVCPLKSTTP